MESTFAPLIVRYIVPSLTDDAALSVIGVNAARGQRIDSLQVPQRCRYVPYDDELPARPLRKALVINSSFALLHMLLFYLAYSPASTSGSWIRALVNVFPERYIDSIVNYCALDRESSAGWPSQPLSLGISFIPVILIWSLEGHRRGNIGSLWSWYVSKFPKWTEIYLPETGQAPCCSLLRLHS